MSYFYKLCTASALVTLTACGGGGANKAASPKAPVSTSGYATPSDSIGILSSFNVRGASFYKYDNTTETGALVTENVRYTISVDGKELRLRFDGKTVILANSEGSGKYQGTLDDTVYTVFRRSGLQSAPYDVVESVFVVVDDADGYTEGHQIIGYNTDPDLMPVTGSATFTGSTEVAVYSNDSFGLGVGTATLTANFAAETVSGSMHIADAGFGGSLTVPQMDVTFSAVPIGGNAFEATPTVVIQSTNVTSDIVVEETALSGQFYGPSGQAAAGDFQATGTLDGDPLIAQGVFVTTR